MQFGGGLIAASGAFWAARRQVTSAERNRERDQKILDLSEQLHGHVTGGDSFCYGYPMFNMAPGVFQWTFIHKGQYPLHDVSVTIHNLSRDLPPTFPGVHVNLGTLFPGRAHTFSAAPSDRHLPSHGYNLFFVGRNGGWTQEIRWAEAPGVLAVANRVVKDGTRLQAPLLLEISPHFTSPLPEDDAWNNPPPYTATPAMPSQE